MPDSDFRDDYELDENGRLRRKKRGTARDGERYAFSLEMMDAAAGFQRTFSDGSVDHSHWSRPGFRVLDNDDPLRRAAFDSYEARRRRKESAWQRKGQPDDDEDDDRRLTPPAKEESAWLRRQALARKAAQATMGTDASVTDLAQLRALADQAWQARNERLRNGWRKRDA